MAWLRKTENRELGTPRWSVRGAPAGCRSPFAEQQWALLHKDWNRLMHIIRRTAAAEAFPAGGLSDSDDGELVDGEPLEGPEILELDITVDGQQPLMPLVARWTDGQGAVSAAVPSWAVDQGRSSRSRRRCPATGPLRPEVRR